MSGFKTPILLRPILWMMEKLQRKTTPPECPYKTCPRTDCEEGCQSPDLRKSVAEKLKLLNKHSL